MMLNMSGKFLTILLGVALIALGAAEAGAQSRSELDVALKELKGRYENARKEMVLLKKQLPDVLYKENSLENRKAYADRVLALRDLMESLANQRKSLGQRIAETPSTPPRFRLVAIKGPKSGRQNDIEINWSKDTPGVTTRYYRGGAWDGPRGRVTNVGPGRGGDDTKFRNVHIGSASLSGVPTEIVLGQPFGFNVKAIRRQEYVNGSPSCDVRSWGGFADHVGAIFYAAGLGGVLKGKKDLRLFCDEAKRMPHPNPRYRAYQATAKQDSISASVRMVPTKVGNTPKGYPRYYYYRMEVSGDGADTSGVRGKEKNILDFNAEDYLTDEQGFLRPGNKHFENAKRKRLKFRVSPTLVMTSDSVVLEYAPVTKDEPFIASIPPFVEPPDFSKPAGAGSDPSGNSLQVSGADGATGGGAGNGGASTGPESQGTGAGGTGGGNVATLTPGGAGSGTSATRGRGSGSGRGGTNVPGAPIPGLTATGPGGAYTQGDIQPRNPTVATFMREWIAAAEPPENADPGYRLRYNNRGNKVGTAPGGIMSDRHDTGAFDPNFLWTNKQGLASLNHCTLGDFVLKRANGTASPGCASSGRQSASGLPQLAGMSVSQAKKTLTRLGLKVRLRPGKPAPRKNLFGKIGRQSPKSGATTKKGQTVTLFIHSKPRAGSVTVPDLQRLSSREAKTALKQAGLKARLRPGKQAAKASLTGKVGRQSPPAGNQVKRNQTVTLYILTPPARGTTVPNLARMSESQAITALRNAGFKPTIRGGAAAPERSLSAKVQGTEPRAGATAGKGSSVVITVYGKYRPTASERRQQAAEQERRQRTERARQTALEQERRARQDRAQQNAVERARREAAERARRQAAERSRQNRLNQLRTIQEQNARREQQRRNAVEAQRQRDLQRQRAAREQQRRQQQQRTRSRPSTNTSGLTPTPRSSRAAVERARRCENGVEVGNRVICGCSGYRYDSRQRTCVKTPTSQRPAPKPRTPPRTAEKPPPPPNMRHLSCGELERLGYKCPTSTMTPGGQICIFGVC